MQTGQRNIVFDIPMQLVGVPQAPDRPLCVQPNAPAGYVTPHLWLPLLCLFFAGDLLEKEYGQTNQLPATRGFSDLSLLCHKGTAVRPCWLITANHSSMFRNRWDMRISAQPPIFTAIFLHNLNARGAKQCRSCSPDCLLDGHLTDINGVFTMKISSEENIIP